MKRARCARRLAGAWTGRDESEVAVLRASMRPLSTATWAPAGAAAHVLSRSPHVDAAGSDRALAKTYWMRPSGRGVAGVGCFTTVLLRIAEHNLRRECGHTRLRGD